MTREEYSTIAPTIPHQPGCYKYYNSAGELLYVGKAKDLRKRVSSYFNKGAANYKTTKLVIEISKIEYTVTDSEHDAFLLENSLIKHYQPRYNIDLKDDKTYPFIVIKNEPFPRVFVTRRVIKDGSEYLGPYTGVGRVRDLLSIVRMLIPLRTCNLNLSQNQIQKGKYKVCLEYHLGNCNGPCEGLQTEDDYQEKLMQVRHILKGNTSEVKKYLIKQMNEYASQLEFEKAEIYKKKINDLELYNGRSTVVNPRLGDVDVVSMIDDGQYAYVNYMMVINGNVIYTKNLKVEKKIEEEASDVLSIVYDSFRETFNSTTSEVITPFTIDVSSELIKLTIPQKGDKKKLLELSEKNVAIFKDEDKRRASLLLSTKSENDHIVVVEELQDLLQLPEPPIHIECFDNSNFQGAYPVSAMVCFKNGVPSKKDYRHYHIKTVKGINDFASMSEVVYRRYKKLLDENLPLPQLVIIDGGKGQLSAAMESIEQLGLTGRMTVIGLAKREESIFFPGDTEPLQLAFDNPAHLLIRYIRDEVHRFGITFHRKIRSKGSIKNELEDIPGIGNKLANELLKEFRSVKNIKGLTVRELTRILGQKKAQVVWDYFNQDKEND
ncbi:MAG: excinuclease ABC subunit C [Chitinophagales bacterium]|nr:excinuclease ABC subunit C [Chitinophagaceae bacterium]MCB9065627.1 excinuclease ABC subunit C [Chitinophagales bacterium]